MATKMIKMTVSEYIEQHSDVTRKEVYRMIADGKLKATKVKGAWIIEIAPEKKVKEYTVRQFVEEYNKINKEMLTKDKEYAMSQMCTKETRILSNMKKMLG